MVFYNNTAVETACNACSGAKMDSGMGMGGGKYGDLATSGVDDDVRSVIEGAVGLGANTIRGSTMTAVDFAKEIGMVEIDGAVDSAVMDTIELLKGNIQRSIKTVESAVNIPLDVGMTAKDVVMFFQNMEM